MTLENRITKLEHDNRRLRRLLVLLVVTIAALFAVGATHEPSFDTISVKYLRVVDDSGRERISLLTDPRSSEPMLMMFDDHKKSTVTLSAVAKSTGIAFQDHDKHAYLGVLDGQPNFMLSNSEATQVIVGAREDRGPRLQIGANNIPVMQLAAYEGVPSISMSDLNSVQRLLLSVVQGKSVISVMGKRAQRGPNVTLTGDDNFATVEATDQAGNFAQLGAAQQEPNVGLTIYERDGTPKWSTRANR